MPVVGLLVPPPSFLFLFHREVKLEFPLLGPSWPWLCSSNLPLSFEQGLNRNLRGSPQRPSGCRILGSIFG